jgi:ABC-type polysaccharide/polyol phosphate transport system ATPase subunit
MKSTSASNEIVLSVENLGLSFKLPVFNQDSFRSVFTKFAQNPISFVSKKAERFVVFEGISFDVNRGDRLGLLGVNGVGKSTLCRCVAGIYRAQRGHIRRHTQVKAIFDTMVGIQPELTGRENANLLAEFLYPNDNNREELVEESLRFSELGEFLNTPYKYYSNGMQARLCLSLISAKGDDLLILDEVFDGADQFFREKVANRVIEMIKKSGAVIFVSHSNDQILKVCNRVIVLDKKKIIFDGDPEQGQRIYSELRK